MILQSDYQLMKNSTPLWIFSRHMSGSIVDPFRNEYVDTSWDRYNIVIPPTRQHFSRISLALDSDLSNHRTVHVKKTWSDVLPMRTGILGKLPFLIKHGVEKHGDERTKFSNDVKDGIQRVKRKNTAFRGFINAYIIYWLGPTDRSSRSVHQLHGRTTLSDSESWAHV